MLHLSELHLIRFTLQRHWRDEHRGGFMICGGSYVDSGNDREDGVTVRESIVLSIRLALAFFFKIRKWRNVQASPFYPSLVRRQRRTAISMHKIPALSQSLTIGIVCPSFFIATVQDACLQSIRALDVGLAKLQPE